MNSIAVIESGLARLKWLAAAARFEIALLRHGLALKAGFNPDQPRVPSGSPGGGQWTTDGGAGRSSNTIPTTEFNAARRLGSRPHGHHFVSHAFYSKLPLRPETRRVFDEAKTGRLGITHGNSLDHRIYNDAVREKFAEFLLQRNLSPQEIVPQDARDFVAEVKNSRDPRIRDFNLKICRQQILYLMRRAPRRLD